MGNKKIMTGKMPRKIIYGNDLFQEIAIPETNRLFIVSYWDLWIAMIAVDQFDNDLDKMIATLRSQVSSYSYLRYELEGVVNHIRLLHQSLEENDLCFIDILAKIDAEFIKKQKPKAKKKILEMHFQFQEKSEWMINTPRKLREEQAMLGYWGCFPIDPEKYAVILGKLYKSGFYTKAQSHTLENKLQRYLTKYEKKASNAELFALYRAFLTVVLEKMESVDDSYGIIGDLYQEVFKTYVLLDRSQLEMKSVDFFLDLMVLVIWEDYGCTDLYQADLFKSLTSAEILLVESILLQQQEELKNLELDYQAKKALAMLKKLHELSQ